MTAHIQYPIVFVHATQHAHIERNVLSPHNHYASDRRAADIDMCGIQKSFGIRWPFGFSSVIYNDIQMRYITIRLSPKRHRRFSHRL